MDLCLLELALKLDEKNISALAPKLGIPFEKGKEIRKTETHLQDINLGILHAWRASRFEQGYRNLNEMKELVEELQKALKGIGRYDLVHSVAKPYAFPSHNKH